MKWWIKEMKHRAEALSRIVRQHRRAAERTTAMVRAERTSAIAAEEKKRALVRKQLGLVTPASVSSASPRNEASSDE